MQASYTNGTSWPLRIAFQFFVYPRGKNPPTLVQSRANHEWVSSAVESIEELFSSETIERRISLLPAVGVITERRRLYIIEQEYKNWEYMSW
ncbi:MAG: hypothetical protein JNM78_06110 [Cyclobacteriaceae bacterium]|nr:hypothetical protein [Cyclobacteriaceae bacterium]